MIGYRSKLFEERSLWVPAFMRDMFWAGMRTTQRVESIHSFFDKFFKAHTKLVEFGEKYIAAVEKRMCQERDADDRDRKWHREVTTGFKLEVFFCGIYTDEKFLEHQVQCERMNHGFVSEEITKDDDTVEYVIDEAVWYFKEGCRGDVLSDTRRCYRASYNKVSHFGVCECRMFDTHGIMCRHIIRVLFQNKINEPSPQYVLNRWMKNIQRKHQRIRVAYHDPSRTNEVRRVDRMQIRFDVVVDKACVCEKRTIEVLKRLDKATEEIDKMEVEEQNKEDRTVEGSSQGNVQHSPYGSDQNHSDFVCTPEGRTTYVTSPSQKSADHHFSQTIRDPIIRKKRGRPKGSRIIGEVEKAITKSLEMRRKNKKSATDLAKDSSSDEDDEQQDIGLTETDEGASQWTVTRSMSTKPKRTKTKGKSVCLRSLYLEDELIKCNNKRLLNLHESSSDESVSF